jgi:hypothetical protein
MRSPAFFMGFGPVIGKKPREKIVHHCYNSPHREKRPKNNYLLCDLCNLNHFARRDGIFYTGKRNFIVFSRVLTNKRVQLGIGVFGFS